MNLAIKNDSMLKEFHRILENKSINTVFQPIVNLQNGNILGYEALSRGPKNSPLESPLYLFDIGEKSNRIWDLELLCRTKAFENAKKLPKGKLLFINVNPEIIHDQRFQKGTTKEYITKYGIDPTSIIFEITEKTAVKDFKGFRKTIDNYVSQGYKIAIDDTGAGYSGLRLLTETHPQYIKVDMELIRDIDKDIVKYELIKTFYEFAQITNMKLIAEGIETINELNTLIDIGVPYGQGYFLYRPAEDFMKTHPFITKIIYKRNLQKRSFVKTPIKEAKIGDLARQDMAIEISSTIQEVYSILNAHYNLQGLVIKDCKKPVGLVMKQKLFFDIEKNKNNKGYLQEKVGKIMEKNPLILDYHTSLKVTCQKALTRKEENVYDYIIVTKENDYYGIVPVITLLQTMGKLKQDDEMTE